MTILQAIFLGIIQGLTEFLPVSSSAHLVITPFLLGWKFPEAEAFAFDVIVQVGTLVAVFAYFGRDLLEIIRSVLTGLWRRQPFYNTYARLGWLIVLATIPAGIIGLAFKDLVEAAFSSPSATGLFLFVTAFLLLLAEKLGKRDRNLDKLNWIDALWIGFFQAVAIFPGVSRSGSTISAGVFRDLERPAAARFSFLMSIPVMLLAGMLATFDLVKAGGLAQHLPMLVAGFVTSALVGYLAIRWLLAYLVKGSLKLFAWYCCTVGAITLLVFFLRIR